METVGNTPVIKLNKISPEGVQMYVKVESFNPAGSVKDRLALNIIEAAERSGKLKPGQTVVEATSGNTGIGLATVCAAKGYPLVVTMADSFSIERRKLMRFLGAKVVLTPRAQKGLGMYKKAKELAEKNNWFLAHQFETDANADIHEATTGKEILSDFSAKLTLLSLDFFEIKDSIACAIASNPADDFILFDPVITNSGIKKKKSGLRYSPSTEYFTLSIYITEFDVTSAPEPAVVGIAANLVNFFLIS